VSGFAVAQDKAPSPRINGKTESDSLVPIPGTGTAEVKGNRLMGADVTNAGHEKLGDVDEVLVTTDGRVSAIIVSTGGVLGVGDRKVVLPWERLRFSSRGSDLVVVTDATRETLRAMPEYSDPNRASTQQQAPVLAPGAADTPRADSAVPPSPLDQTRPIRPVPKTE
jgi:hypothetical protein